MDEKTQRPATFEDQAQAIFDLADRLVTKRLAPILERLSRLEEETAALKDRDAGQSTTR